MKVAIPTRNNVVDDHFGHCDYYTIYEIDNQKNIVTKELLRTQGGCGCKSNVAGILKEMGVTVMLAGNMGQGAFNMLQAHEIKVMRGCNGLTEGLINSYLQGEISDSDILCDQHECHD